MKKIIVLAVGLSCASAYAQVTSEIAMAQALKHSTELVKMCRVLHEQNISLEQFIEQLIECDNDQAYFIGGWLESSGLSDIATWFGLVSLWYGFWYIIDPEVFKAMCDEDILQNAVEERS